VLVATDAGLPAAALARASALAGRAGEVVLAAVVLVPHAQPLGAGLDLAVTRACDVLDAGERLGAGGRFDTRLTRARSLVEGVAGILREEPFDTVVLELSGRRPRPHPGLEALIDGGGATVVLVRPGGAQPLRQAGVV
jgi:hypothetical protein